MTVGLLTHPACMGRFVQGTLSKVDAKASTCGFGRQKDGLVIILPGNVTKTLACCVAYI
jgi:hypothetical protein